MEDEQLQETVESLLGKGATVVDCERSTSVREEETLLVNGVPVSLGGEDGAALRQALLAGTPPPSDLLARLLSKAGLLRAPVRLHTSLSVASSVVTRESVTVRRDGQLVDERSKEKQEDNFYSSDTSEVWEPVGAGRGAPGRRGPPHQPGAAPPPSRPPANGSELYSVREEDEGALAPAPPLVDTPSQDGLDELLQLAEQLQRVAMSADTQGGLFAMETPTIFGTVASDQTPKDGTSRKVRLLSFNPREVTTQLLSLHSCVVRLNTD
ncbi:uncharacterized protein [Hetaerina americana]|uniref:uncharacterized protein n=1 Tax=Hetaerina americana TaxID=62018 RepID=UPI003A7F40AA